MNLLILESPGKVKKVQSYLGNDWKVVASVGHVRDLPERELGVSLSDFTPSYTLTERGRDVLGRLKGLAASASASIWPPTPTAKVRPLPGIWPMHYA